MKLIVVGNQAVNLDHVVCTSYTPPSDNSAPSLHLTLTALVKESDELGYDGTDLVAVATSAVLVLTGAEAERVWNHFKLIGLVLILPEPENTPHCHARAKCEVDCPWRNTCDNTALTPAESAAMAEDVKSAG